MGPNAPQPCNCNDIYGRLFSRRLDLVGDYAGSEPFLIDVDSLLLHCFSDDKLDFCEGFQMLHAVWLVESFLENLRRRNCNFHLAFFDDHAPICVPSHVNDLERAKCLLARDVIHRHLEANLVRLRSPVSILAFPSLASSAFETALVENSYMFIAMNDGAADSCDCSDHTRDKAVLRQHICSFISRGYNVALINGLEWKDTKAIATIIEGTAKKASAPEPMPEQAKPHTAPENGKCTTSSELQVCEIFSKYHSTPHRKLSERLYLVVAATAILLSEGSISVELASAFLTHASVQGQLRLGCHANRTPQHTEAATSFVHNFCKVSMNTMREPAWQAFVNSAGAVCDIADLIDGRLFSTLIEDNNNYNSKLNEESSDVLQSLIHLVKLITGIRLPQRGQSANADIQRANGDLTILCIPDRKLLPFSEHIFNKHLKPIKLDTDWDATQHLTENNSKTFRELTHWHNSKRPLDCKTLGAIQQRRTLFERRRNQRFMAEMMVYAASLTNAVGKTLEPEIIVQKNMEASGKPNPANKHSKPRDSSKADDRRKENSNHQQPRNKQFSNKKCNKKTILEQSAARRKEHDEMIASKAVESWNVLCEDIERVPDVPIRHSKAVQYLNALQSTKGDAVRPQVEIYILNCLLLQWKSSIKRHPESPEYGIAARIWNSIARLRNIDGITPFMVSNLRRAVDILGLPFVIADSTSPDRKLPFEFALNSSKATNMAIPLPSEEFQLLHCGPYFDRKMDSAPDHRVPFLPDGWQRKVLDAIDAEKGLFVVAPTSAGKTFISFYAMKKVLEASDDGVLVYVAPTKALVNQIAAEIQARFSKSYKHPGMSVWGIYTRDYRINNATGCQVLVTVPHILQIMLLAPSNAESWSARIKRIIFDEVHCIGQAEDGIVWEQLLLLAPCPIIALSATVGNPEEFHGWLASAQNAIGTELIMVHHPHRYSDLRKFVYTPTEGCFVGLPKPPVLPPVSLDKGTGFKFVHPVASLLNRSRGIPEDFSLEARDCYTLWQAMKSHETDAYRVDESLSPQSALPAIIAQADTVKWGQSLKQLLVEWMEDHDSPFDKVVQDLGHNIYRLEAETDVSSENLVTTVLPLLSELHGQSALPAILFNYDRSQCELICKNILDKLKKAENIWKDSSTVWRKKIAAWESWRKSENAVIKKRSGKRTTSSQHKDGMSKADLEREMASTDEDAWESFDPNVPIDRFHFTDRMKLQSSELDEYAKELDSRGVPNWLTEALSRGIGVHHAGMNRKYRHVVKVLFRKGYHRVVIATGTLALGINMPCKTVVFCGDSVYLTALNFRQAAGRAGRRGFDLLGNVVFHGIPVSKVCRLLSSRLPDLTGHFPITTTLVLRLCSLLSESHHSAFSVRSVDALLSQPRLYLGGEDSRMTVLHHLRFSLEYLRRQFLLDQSGVPLNFAGCVSHLYYTESSNFAFHALLKEGYFHRLCAGIRQHPGMRGNILETMMLVLSHIFSRRYCRQVDREFVEQVVKQSPSMVFLPPLPANAAAIMQQHNRKTLEIFSMYVKTYVHQHIDKDDCFLPLSGIKFGGSSGAMVPTIRSHFVALSGHGDDFQSVSELCSTVRAGVFLEESAIPHLLLEAELPLNAYLLDFFKHGDVTALVKANKIRRGDIWFVLNDFSMILATIITSLTNFIHQDAESDSEVFEKIGEDDMHEKLFEEQLCELPPVEPRPSSVQPAKVGSNKIPDSWEDGISDDSDDSKQVVNNVFDTTKNRWEQDLKVPAWEDEKDGNLYDVLEGFKGLADEFDRKFKAIWA